ncbi:hypothetical protein [Dubosiella newyorkensis]|uniref:hypothetical protein n=1 Tax=Dubosiella newyorkensis TaxID=1862672 RepID=UPI003F66C335
MIRIRSRGKQKTLDAKEKDGEYVIRFGAGWRITPTKIGMMDHQKDRVLEKSKPNPKEAAKPSEAPKSKTKRNRTPQETNSKDVPTSQIATIMRSPTRDWLKAM